MTDPASAAPLDAVGRPRLPWVDRFKGIALLWIFLNHTSEQIFGAPLIANPNPDWPPFVDRLHQLLPLSGYGVSGLPANLFRWIGWFGDQAVGLFLLLSGFGLAWGWMGRREGGGGRWREFYARRLARIYPQWWAAHLLVPVAWAVGFMEAQKSVPAYLLSLVGLRVTPAAFYSYVPAWWFVGLLIQLYLVFPLLWGWLEKAGPVRFLVGAGVAGVAARAAGIGCFTSYLEYWLRGSVFITRLPEFALGMVIARTWREAPGSAPAWLAGWGGRLSCLALLLAGNGLSLSLWGMAVAPFLMAWGGFGLLWPLAARGSGSRRDILTWIGVHSYPLYLVHHLFAKALLPFGTSWGGGAVARMLLAAVLSVGAALLLEGGTERAGRWLRERRNRWGTRRLTVALGGAGLLLVLVALGAEWVSVKLDPMEVDGWGERPSLEIDARFGWRLKPSQVTHLRWNSYDYTVRANGLGFPGPEVPPAKAPRTVRILTTGDAFTSAEGVDTDQAWPRLLESRLAAARPGQKIEVLNFAITAYGPNQYARVIEHFAPIYRPDLIIIEFFINDYEDALTPDEEFQRNIGFGRAPRDSLVSMIRLANLRSWFRERCVGPVLGRVTGKPPGYARFYGGLNWLEGGGHPMWTDGKARVAECLRRIRETARSTGARVMIAMAPSAVQVWRTDQVTYLPGTLDLSDPSRWDIERPQRVTRELAEALLIPFIDLRPPLRQAPECPYQQHNLHWTVVGHRIVADHLAGILLNDSSLLPPAEDR